MMKKIKMKRKSKHKRLVSELVQRLAKKDHYEYIGWNVPYFKEGLEGEIDVIAYSSTNKTFHFYEVKSRNTLRNYQKAVIQFERYKRAFPDVKVKGVYVTPKTARRMR